MKLAIGDLFAEPFKNALIYINAFLIAITKIIRAFKPIDKESETAGAGMQQFADDIEDANDAATGGGNLDFDEFRVLSSGEDSQLSITQAITEELQKQIQAYNDQISAMNEVGNKAVEIAEKIRDWFIVVDENGEFVDFSDELGGQLLKRIIDITNIIKNLFEQIKPSIKSLSPIIEDLLLLLTDESVLSILEQVSNFIAELINRSTPFVNKLVSFVLNLIEQLLPILDSVFA